MLYVWIICVSSSSSAIISVGTSSIGKVSDCHFLGRGAERKWSDCAFGLCFPSTRSSIIRDVQCETGKHNALRREHYHLLWIISVKRNCGTQCGLSPQRVPRVVICQLHMETWWENCTMAYLEHIISKKDICSTMQAALCDLTKDERRFFQLSGGTRGINGSVS